MASVAQDYSGFHIDVEACSPTAKERRKTKGRTSKNRGLVDAGASFDDSASHDKENSVKKSKSAALSPRKASRNIGGVASIALKKISSRRRMQQSLTKTTSQDFAHVGDSENEPVQLKPANDVNQMDSEHIVQNSLTRRFTNGFGVKKLLLPLLTIGQESSPVGSQADGKK